MLNQKNIIAIITFILSIVTAVIGIMLIRKTDMTFHVKIVLGCLFAFVPVLQSGLLGILIREKRNGIGRR